MKLLQSIGIRGLDFEIAVGPLTFVNWEPLSCSFPGK